MDNTRPLSTILFDAGGVLVHPDYYFLRRKIRNAGFAVTSRHIRQAEYAAKAAIDRSFQEGGKSTDETRRQPYFSLLLQQLGVEQRVAQGLLRQFDVEHRKENLWRLRLPSTPGVLANLRDLGLRLGVVSNADGRIVAILEKAGIAHFFDVIVDSHVVGAEKPDPRIFHIALDRLGAHAAQTIFVGDIYAIDILGAEKAGLRAVLIDTLGQYRDVPCVKIRHLQELMAFVLEEK